MKPDKLALLNALVNLTHASQSYYLARPGNGSPETRLKISIKEARTLLKQAGRGYELEGWFDDQ